MGKKLKKYEKLPVFYTTADSPSATATTLSTNHATSSNATASSSNQGTPVFFWKDDADNGYLCQWYKCSFTDPENPTLGTFNCTEQWMMYHKAMLFGDDKMADQIMKATSPRKQKGFGAQVQNFNETKWNAARSEIVEKGNILKFSQCTNVASMRMGDKGDPQPLKDLLLATGDRLLAEASPFDKIWGIGFKAEEAMSHRSQWGQNLLGQALMKVRQQLREEAEEH